MKKIAVAIIFVFLAIAARPQGLVISSTFNTNSAEGDFSGTWSFSFSTNAFMPTGNGEAPWIGQWNTVSASMSFTDAVSGAVINLSFTVGGIESPNEFGVRSTINVTDPSLGTVIGGLGDSGGNGYQESTMLVYPGHSSSITNSGNQDPFYFYSTQKGNSGQGLVNRNDNLSFDGIYGTGGGTWTVSYPVPEPSTVAQIALGAVGLGLARLMYRRRS